MPTRSRIHESVALAALFSTSWALHVSWMTNLLVAKSADMNRLFNVAPSIGPIAGLYLCSLSVGIILFISMSLWLRGKDCTPLRHRAFAFFVFSVGLFTLMTLPIVYGTTLGVTRS
jgi:hypothetical protein